MKKVKVLRKTVAIVFLLGALLIPLHTPVVNMVPGVQTITTKAEAKAALSKKQAKKKLKKWLKKNEYWSKDLIVKYDRTEGKEYVFHAYFDEGDHTTTQNWYYVNFNSGKVRAEF